MTTKLTNSFTTDNWTDLRTKLQNQNKSLLTSDWKDAIKLMSERINERYFEPLNLLIEKGNDKGDGFTILTVECSLIEFLATLEGGLLFKRDKLSTDPQYFYKHSARIYQRFLRTAIPFDGVFFAGQSSSILFSTNDFYKNVRCALIHEAQTKEYWEVKIFGKTKSSDNENQTYFQVTTEGKKIIYRTALFKALKTYFQNFMDKELMQENERGRVLRKHLARKIDHIAERNPDNSFWW
jgi:hypothetical protein